MLSRLWEMFITLYLVSSPVGCRFCDVVPCFFRFFFFNLTSAMRLIRQQNYLIIRF